MRPNSKTQDTYSDLSEALLSALGRWTGCDWETTFGERRLNLSGMRSRQARLLADVTSTIEANYWVEATLYLQHVERDAADAEELARRAIQCLTDGHAEAALTAICRAVMIEAKYREPTVWTPLRDAILAYKLRGARDV